MSLIHEISQKGIDVSKATPYEKIFSNLYPTGTIRRRISIDVTTDTSSDIHENSYVHGFGYVPQMLCFVTTYFDRYVNVPQTWNEKHEASAYPNLEEYFDCYSEDNIVTVSARAYNYTPGVGGVYLANTYTFDILLFMEEALLS